MEPTSRLTSRIDPVGVPLAPDEQEGWKPYYLFRGLTRDETFLSCHVSVLAAGRCPHPPHTHKEEEFLLVLAGEVDLTLPQLASDREDRRLRLQTGQFVYYPADFPHTLTSASQTPANYLMFKWHSGRKSDKAQLHFRLADTAEYLAQIPPHVDFSSQLIFEGQTDHLKRLHVHVSSLAPRAGYEPHADAYDVAIVVLDGTLRTLGQRAEPHAVVYYAAGDAHGLSNLGHAPARYLVVEFHGHPEASFWSKVQDPQWWKRKLTRLFAVNRQGFGDETDQHVHRQP
jgi:quercetin dioxygenase-like cupin family protein